MPQPAVNAYKTRTLVVDSDPGLRRQLHIALGARGYDITESETAHSAFTRFVETQPDIVLIDLQLPDASGISLMHAMHAVERVPVLILSVSDDAARKIEALEAGAEDYIVKPLDAGEVLARIRVALRRARRVNDAETFRSGPLEVDFVRRLVRVNSHFVQLTPTEYGILRLLILHKDEPVTHRQIWSEVRCQADSFNAHSVRVHMSNLRQKLERATTVQNIVTEVGVGYRFRTQ